jgi:hypothetical protein
MKTSSTMVFVCTTALTGALVLGASLAGCRADTSVSAGTSVGGSSSTSSSSSSSGTGGATGSVVVTIPQITDSTAPGHVGLSTQVQLNGAIALSNKFFVSKSSETGSCLWGVFLSVPGIAETAAYSGLLALSYGTPATASSSGEAFCPTIQANQPAGDAFPDDVAPGDVLTVVGKTDAYIPEACSAADAGPGASDVKGIQLTNVTSVTRTATGAATPTPHVLDSTDLATLAAGTDTTWLDQWGSVRVELQNVSVVPYGGDGGTLEDNYGHMYLTDGVQIGDKLYYVGYVKDSDACYAGPVYPTNSPTFTSITGFVYLDFCNWGIVPSNKCFDLVPPSDDCASVVDPDAGTDPSAGDAAAVSPTVCLH